MIPSTRHPHVTHAMIAAELAREAEARRRTYPAMIEQGRMTAEDAERGHAVCAAWADDIARVIAFWAAPFPRGAMPCQPRTRGFTWAERRSALDRELQQRARLYPRWIAQARLDAGEAQQRTQRLAAMADLYDEGLDWHDSFGTRPLFHLLTAPTIEDEDQREALAQWRTHCNHVWSSRDGQQSQKELAL